MADYHNEMKPEAQGMARATGIAAGWLQQEKSGARYQIGCNACGFYSAERVSAQALDLAQVDLEPVVQRRVKAEFEKRAAENGCAHWPAYLALLRAARDRADAE
jgi:hypothetical protein